jgi:hypothetical protein
MVTVEVFPIEGKTHTVEPGIEPGTSWLVARQKLYDRANLCVQLEGVFVEN